MCAAEGMAAVTRDNTLSGVSACPQETTLGLSALHKLPARHAPFASKPCAPQAPSTRQWVAPRCAAQAYRCPYPKLQPGYGP